MHHFSITGVSACFSCHHILYFWFMPFNVFLKSIRKGLWLLSSAWKDIPSCSYPSFFFFHIHLWVWMLTCALPWPVSCVSISARPRVLRSCAVLLSVCRFACALVCWFQFTQIWPCCRQVSLLREVLQRDSGRQCYPGRRPSPAADVRIFCRPEGFEVFLC